MHLKRFNPVKGLSGGARKSARKQPLSRQDGQGTGIKTTPVLRNQIVPNNIYTIGG